MYVICVVQLVLATTAKKDTCRHLFSTKSLGELSSLRVPSVSLHFGGESLLHPQIKEFITCASKKRHAIGAVGIFSNGSFFDQEIAELFVRLKVDFCSF
jgi:MoaA/NifB/PqqE/SkfB family radical SAM enzyme